MQKKLADYLKILIDQRDTTLHEFYEPGALLLCDEAVILLGLLLGLNVVDCNLCLKVLRKSCHRTNIAFKYDKLTTLILNRRRISIVNKELLTFLSI